MKFVIPAALAAVASLCPVVAQAQDREVFTVRVSRSGLDLADADHRAQFDSRVRRAAYRACQFNGGRLIEQLGVNRCVAEMRRDADQQVAMIVDRQQRQLAAR
ncbi:UrcA family protein [uncultured Sphingomonas sp.]|uniref:UrcA family protein n=1 Tax=uncultured Sphingomonas sp. TaxID=158754 RepID=UPI0025D3A71E|nr:UrcA family protein [uncultured Sphingomonas sp.]